MGDFCRTRGFKRHDIGNGPKDPVAFCGGKASGYRFTCCKWKIYFSFQKLYDSTLWCTSNTNHKACVLENKIIFSIADESIISTDFN